MMDVCEELNVEESKKNTGYTPVKNRESFI